MSQLPVTIIPGVQKPHWRAWFSWKAIWIGSSWPFLLEALDGRDLLTLGHGRERGCTT